MATPRYRRPYVLLWHSEPLPPARATGLPLPWLNLREVAKVVLRDARATDVYTNYFTLRSLHRVGIPDVLVLSSRGRQEFLAEREEILRHKWIESERLGQDIGFEHALLDWIRKHRESWRSARRAQGIHSTPPMPMPPTTNGRTKG